MIAIDDFLKVDIRVGTIKAAILNPGARKPAYRLTIDFGPAIGLKTSSAQITHIYAPEQLVGMQVAAVVNFPPRQIASTRSEVLVLGFSDANEQIVLLQPERVVPNGQRMH